MMEGSSVVWCGGENERGNNNKDLCARRHEKALPTKRNTCTTKPHTPPSTSITSVD